MACGIMSTRPSLLVSLTDSYDGAVKLLYVERGRAAPLCPVSFETSVRVPPQSD